MVAAVASALAVVCQEITELGLPNVSMILSEVLIIQRPWSSSRFC